MIGRQHQRTFGDDAAETNLGRIVEANRRLWTGISTRLELGAEWQADVLFRAMIDTVPDYLFIKDTESRFVVANRAVAFDVGATPEEIIGKRDFELHPSELAAQFYADEQNVMRTGNPLVDIEEYIVGRDGNRKWLLTTKVPLRNERNEIVGLVGISRDVTARKLAEHEVRFLAHHDALTRLPNRSLLMDRLERAIRLAERNRHWVTVAFMDLDNFKMINDTLGHGAGDAVLKTVAERMVAIVRASDTVARLGGDEFVIVMADQPHNPGSRMIADKVNRAVQRPIALGSDTVVATCSIGLAKYPEQGLDADTLLRSADTAMYRAKAASRTAGTEPPPEAA